MTDSQRFAEVGKLLDQDSQFRTVAGLAVVALDESDVSRLTREENARDGFFQQLWDEVVEPLHTDDDYSTYDMWRMSMEGVLIDNLIALWAHAGEHNWPARVRGLLSLEPVSQA
jgi:hypothetical protein